MRGKMRLWGDPAVAPARTGCRWPHARALFGVGLLCAISGCAFDVSHVTRVPTEFQATAPNGSGWTLRQGQSIGVGSGYSTVLQRGTRWRLAGHITQGDVYRTSDQIVTVEASNIFEAMVVIQGDRLAGFYLPVEHSFVAATEPVTLSIERGTQ
ncbi:MAG TPA: hypothetical protein VIZ17_11500 [Acetobacteraceae bacterium]